MAVIVMDDLRDLSRGLARDLLNQTRGLALLLAVAPLLVMDVVQMA
jgi:hypothetical protein